jgi:hypothetical protein
MDGKRFDAMTRSFSRGLTRRQFAAAIGSALAGVVGSSGLAFAARCREVADICRKDGDCCSGLCAEADSQGRRRCFCPAGTEPCGGACVDPTVAYLTDPNNCGVCGNVCQRTRCGVAACVDGVCTVGPDSRMVGRSCDDGNACTEDDLCRADGSCAGTPKTCAVTEPRCQSAACNPATGQCETTNFDVGTPCADDDRCDGDEACDGSGVCAAGVPVQCPQPNDPCQAAICDSTSGSCVTSNAPDGAVCNVVGIPSGVCCGGICSQCCSDASTCANLFGETDNVVFTCQDPAQVGGINCNGECDSSVIPPTNPICTNPAVLAGVNQQCMVDGQPVPCLTCRLPVGSQCSADTHCCGFCVSGTCQEGAAGSSCADNDDCASDLFCNSQGICAQPLLIGAICTAGVDTCVDGASCGSTLQTSGTYCCRPIGSACTVDQQCCQDDGVQERCILGVCKTRVDAGERCGKKFDCKAGLTCLDGMCTSTSGLGGICDSDDDCTFDSTAGVQPICSGGTCRLPNGAACTTAAECGIGVCLDCGAQGHICAECCQNGGVDPVDCGDIESEKLCCNHACIYRNDDHHCGTCNVDCTCGGADPYRYCTTVYDSETPSWDWRAICSGTYSESSGHCTSNGDFCSTTCPPPPPPCDCTAPITSLFCYASCKGQYPELSLSTCAEVGGTCLNGNDDTCCGDAICGEVYNCPPNTSICFSYDYLCRAA